MTLDLGQVGFLQNELEEIAKSLGEKELVQLVAKARQLAASRNGECSIRHSQLRPRIEIIYAGLSPFWAAFADVQYTPEIRCFHSGSGRQMEPPADLRFRITPAPPAAIAFDPLTGAFTGSAILSHATGAQYQVTAFIEEDGEQVSLGCCAVTFAVLPPELAAIYNDAFQIQEAPAFQELHAQQCSRQGYTVVSHKEATIIPGSNLESPPSSPVRPSSAVPMGRATVRALGKPLQGRVSPEVPRWFGAGVPMMKGPPALRARPSTAAGVRSYVATDKSASSTTYQAFQRPVSAPQW